MHNQWQTNFNADQHGEFNWSYTLTSGRNTNTDHGSGFGWNQRIPVLVRVLPATTKTVKDQKDLSLIHSWPENVQLVKAFPSENNDGIMLHVRETQGIKTQFSLSDLYGKRIDLKRVDLLGEAQDNGKDNSIDPLESAFYLLKTN